MSGRLGSSMSTVSSRSARLFAARARARRWAAARPLLVGSLALLLVGGTAWVAVGSGALDVDKVDVVGSSALSDEAVHDAAATAIGDPMLTVDTDAVRARVAAVPAVAEVEVSRAWPATLRVRVVERTPVFAVRLVTGWQLVDDEGVPYTSVSHRPKTVLPLDVTSPGPDDESTRAALAVLDALPRRVHRQVVEVSAPTPAGVRLRLRGGGVVVWGGPDDGERKARALAVLLRQAQQRQAQQGGGAVVAARRYDVSTPGIVTTR